jgi:cytochrome c-type biogenesis protein CcmE
MTPRRKRLFVVLAILGGVAASVALAVMASRENIMFYYDPSQVVAGKAPAAKRFRIGGMVVKGSVARKPGDLQVRFVLTDFAHEVPVEYTGVLPDLFREGQGIIAHGTMNANGAFVADEVLAKHDEKYMPPEVAASLKKKTERRTGSAPIADAPKADAPRGNAADAVVPHINGSNEPSG